MPGFHDLPADETTDLNAFDFQQQFQDAVFLDRARVAGMQCRSPKCSATWYEGTVSAITETTLTDSGAAWCTVNVIPWNCTDPAFDDLLTTPVAFDVIIDPDNDDYTKIVRTQASATGATTAVIGNIRDYVTAGYITSVSSLVGKPFVVSRSNSGDYGLWWNERLQIPNDYEYGRGTVAASTATTMTGTTNDGYGNVIEPNWTVNEHAGRELLVYAVDNFLKRITIVSNTRTVLTFASQASLPEVNEKFCIVAANGKAFPGRELVTPFIYHRGNRSASYASHGANDALDNPALPTDQITIEGGGEFCPGEDVQVWDFDFWTDQVLSEDDYLCGRKAEKSYCPDIFKSIRGWQLSLEASSFYYVDPVGYNGREYRTAPPLINPAVMFYLASQLDGGETLDVFTSTTTTAVSSVINFSSTAFPYTPCNVYYAILKTTGGSAGEWTFGTGVATSATSITSNGGSFSSVEESCQIIIALGWSRFHEREFARMFPCTIFIPGTDEDGAIDPPDVDGDTGCDGAGQWFTIPASTNYIERDPPSTDWATTARGFEDDGTVAFVNGDYARLIGSNYFGPSVRDQNNGKIDITSPLAPYWDRAFVGAHEPTDQRLVDAQLSGAIVSATTTQVTTDKNWWAGVLRTESLSFTSGSTTAGTDSSKADNCYWETARYPDLNIYGEFVLEVLMSGSSFSDPIAVIEKRMITTGSPSGALTFPAFSASVSLKQARIKEPRHQLNQFKGRQAKFCHVVAGTREYATRTILGNDNETLFLDSALPWTPIKDDTWEIVEPLVGGIYKRSGGAWVLPSGADAARLGVTDPQDFKGSPLVNRATWVKRHGKFLLNDIVNPTLFNELWAVCNVLVHARGIYDWIDKPSDESAEVPNYIAITGPTDQHAKHDGIPGPCPNVGDYASWQDVVDDAMWYWDNATVITASGAPFTSVYVGGDTLSSCYTYVQGRLFAWGRTELDCTLRLPVVDFYAYSVINVTDPDPVVDCPNKISFNDFDTGLLFRKWRLWNTATASGSVVYTTDSLGDLTRPPEQGQPFDGFVANCDDRPDPGSTCFDTMGYYVLDEMCIYRYDHDGTGGFTYYGDSSGGYLGLSEGDYLTLTEGDYLALLE